MLQLSTKFALYMSWFCFWFANIAKVFLWSSCGLFSLLFSPRHFVLHFYTEWNSCNCNKIEASLFFFPALLLFLICYLTYLDFFLIHISNNFLLSSPHWIKGISIDPLQDSPAHEVFNQRLELRSNDLHPPKPKNNMGKRTLKYARGLFI